jgi:hypothetical protein
MWFERFDTILARRRPEPVDVLVAAALRDRLRQSQDTLDAALRSTLSALCVEMRRDDPRPEGVILELKRIWRGVVVSRPAAEASKRQELLANAVTFCIEEYYRQPQSRAADTADNAPASAHREPDGRRAQRPPS